MTYHWYKDYANVKKLGAALVEVGYNAKQLQDYYEKPWKWTEEWEALQISKERLEEIINS